KVGVDPPVTRFVGIGQGGARHVAAEAHVIELGADGAQAGFDVAQALAVGQLGERHGEVLIPARQIFQVAITRIAGDALLELLVRKELDQLGKDCTPGVHPALSLLRETPPSTRLTPFSGSNRFCSKTDVPHSIYVACAFIAKVSPDTSDPDHSTLAEFRQRHLEALAGLFCQALQLCEKAGLVKLGHVAIDGSKIQGNASKHQAMSYERMSEAEKKLQAEVEGLLQRAEAVDAAEDEKYGKDQAGDELPAELARRESRLAKIRAAKAELEAEAKQKAEEKQAAAEVQIRQRQEQAARTGKKMSGREPQVPHPEQAVPDPKAQRNFTDPESRIMPDGGHKGSFVQGYNAQIAVDGEAQVIVAAEVTQQSNDKQQLGPHVGAGEAECGGPAPGS